MHFVRGGGGGGGLKSLARIFFSIILARISRLSGFVRILPNCLPQNYYLKNSRGRAPPPPQPHGPYAYDCMIRLLFVTVNFVSLLFLFFSTVVSFRPTA